MKRAILMLTACLLWLSMCIAAEPDAAADEKLELLDGDRVVFLGNTLIEREQKYGYWELMLTMAWPERNVTFRNLGWSGDTVWGESRAGFGTQADGFKALVAQVNAAKPTVIFVGYGNVEAFAGEAGLPKFIDGFNKLLDVLEATKARIVVVGPIYQDLATSKNPNAEAYNKSVDFYSDALKSQAVRRGHHFVGLNSTALPSFRDPAASNTPLSVNGMDHTMYGYTADLLRLQQGLGIDLDWQVPSSAIKTHDDLFRTVLKKNELFFHRWRPQNETYLFGFRKHEQGNNAKEVFAFDPLIEAEEKKIAELRVKLAAELKGAVNAK